MKKNEIRLTPEFKTQTAKAIVSIILFVITYLVILLLSVALTALCIAGGVLLIALKPMFITIALGIGLASMGILIMIFLLKFIFKSHKVDRSHLIEIKSSDEPELFRMIDEIVQEVGASYPKKVYLSSDVNASVFYDSSFWSMFLPIKKNLQIGMGLVNTVTKEELRAILSHEFGHFAQRSMKVGSFVYYVNQVIYNMLYENESYQNIIRKWANVSGYFSFFVAIAIKVIAGVQWILRKLYEVVNKNYMALSREMEFHADEIAASVTGYEPLKSSLLRMSLADNSFNNVINFYNERISNNFKSENIYKEQSVVISLLAELNNFRYRNNLPLITLEDQSKFDKSKLVIKDQWSSHPTLKERIDRLERTNMFSTNETDYPANSIFKNIEHTQKQVTGKLFESVNYEGEAMFFSFDKFRNEYQAEILVNSFPGIFNNYYDLKNPAIIDLQQTRPDNKSFDELFSDEKVDLVYNAVAVQNDLQTLTSISDNSLSLKTFDYDGRRYRKNESGELMEKLKLELQLLNEQIQENDYCIYNYFRKLELTQGKPKKLELLYSEYFEFDKAFDVKYALYTQLIDALEFVSAATPFDQISDNLNGIKPLEEKLKNEITNLMGDNLYHADITKDKMDTLQRYISGNLEYFNGSSYNDENLQIFYSAMHTYAYLLSRGYFLMKKRILQYQEELSKDYEREYVAEAGGSMVKGS